MSALIIALLLPVLAQIGAPITRDASPSEPIAQAAQAQAQALPQGQTQPRPIQPTQPRKPTPSDANRPQAKPRQAAPKKKQPAQERSGFLSAFWTFFAPPGDYTTSVALAGGANFMETAFGARDPNVIGRAQFNYRFDPQLPLQLFGGLDYSQYASSAGPLEYTTRFITPFIGGGLVYWLAGLRLDLGLELGAAVRTSSQTDGLGYERSDYAMSPTAGLIGGVGFSIFGHVSLNLQGAMRYRPAGQEYLSAGRLDYTILYGLEWIIDAKPVKLY